jgi:hypothetical protein
MICPRVLELALVSLPVSLGNRDPVQRPFSDYLSLATAAASTIPALGSDATIHGALAAVGTVSLG